MLFSVVTNVDEKEYYDLINSTARPADKVLV